MKQILATLGLIIALTGCNSEPQELEKNPISAGETIIEDSLYKLTLTDIDGDGTDDAISIERKFPLSYGSHEPRTRYFVTSMPRSPTGILDIEVNLVKPKFFNQYSNLFNPNTEHVISTYRGQ